MALCGHPLLFFVLCLSICPRPGGSHFQHPIPASLAKRQPFPAELATLLHRPWAPKPSEPSISGFSSTKSPFLCAFVVRNPHFRAFRAQNRDFWVLRQISCCQVKQVWKILIQRSRSEARPYILLLIHFILLFSPSISPLLIEYFMAFLMGEMSRWTLFTKLTTSP